MCLEKLLNVDLSVPLLLETGIGKIVRKLRDEEGRVGRMAGKLVVR